MLVGQRSVISLDNRESLVEIKKFINSCVGEEVAFVTDRGKRRMKTKVGIVKNTFRNIFTVEISEGYNDSRTVSFKYSDVLTKEVEFVLANEFNEQSEVVETIEVTENVSVL